MCDRIKVLERVERLYPPSLLDRVLLAIRMPRRDWPSPQQTLGERSLALLQWADSPGGCGLDQLSTQLDRFMSGPHFSHTQDETHLDAWGVQSTWKPNQQPDNWPNDVDPFILRRLAEEMVRQGRAMIDVAGLTNAEREIVRQLVARGVLCEHASQAHSSIKYVALADPQQCQWLLADWTASQAELPNTELLDTACRFPLLVEAIADSIQVRFPKPGRDLFRAFLVGNRDVTESLVATVMRRTSGPARHAFSNGTGRGERPALPTMFFEALAMVVQEGGSYAFRGLALCGQEMLEAKRLEVADPLFQAVADWSDRSDDASFSVQVANEQGRLYRRQRRFGEAEQILRQARRRSLELGDHALTIIVTNNLAQALIETSSVNRDHKDEAITLLQQNIEMAAQDDSIRRHVAITYHHLATAHAASDPVTAESYYLRDIKICREFARDTQLADALDQYGVFLADQGRHDASQEVLREELDLLDAIAEPRRQGRASANLGRSFLADGAARRDRGLLERAVELLTHGRRVFESLDEAVMLAPTLENLGRAQFRLGDPRSGTATLKASIEQYRRIDDDDAAGDIQRELDDLD